MVRGVAKSFEGEQVLREIGLTVEKSSSVILLGPSGCGKTTLLRTIAGLERPDSGTISLGDRTLTDRDTSIPPERRKIGMVFQDWALFPHLNVAANVSYGLPKDFPDKDAVIAETLEMVALSGFGKRMPDTLSGGEQQRVAIAAPTFSRGDHVALSDWGPSAVAYPPTKVDEPTH